MADLDIPDPASEDLAGEAGPARSGSRRVRFPLVRSVLAPRTTWQARRLAVDFGGGMDARTAWVMARLARHSDEHDLAMRHLNAEREPD
ncbi:hypothetical protein ACIBUR_23545 [Streptomyces anulatus]